MKNTSDFLSNIALDLAELRKQCRLTQEELAQMVGTKQEAISRIETGAAVPSWRLISRLAKALNAEAVITFKPIDGKEALPPINTRGEKDYLCMNCIYRWRSHLNRPVIQCPQCHQRQGVLYLEYDRALNAFREMQQQVKKSPPLRKPPPFRSLSRNSRQMIAMLLQIAGRTFPSPRLPVNLFFRILEQSRGDKNVDSHSA